MEQSKGLGKNESAHLKPQPFSIGDIVPDFTLPASDRDQVRLQELVSEKSLVLLFYRGYW